jgi:hypothetical protein
VREKDGFGLHLSRSFVVGNGVSGLGRSLHDTNDDTKGGWFDDMRGTTFFLLVSEAGDDTMVQTDFLFASVDQTNRAYRMNQLLFFVSQSRLSLPTSPPSPSRDIPTP